MKKYIIYSIEHHKKDKCYYVWKTLYKDDIPAFFKGIYHGNRYSCNKYCNDNNIKLKEKIKLPS